MRGQSAASSGPSSTRMASRMRDYGDRLRSLANSVSSIKNRLSAVEAAIKELQAKDEVSRG